MATEPAPLTPGSKAWREDLIARALATPVGRANLAMSMFTPAQTVLDFWPKPDGKRTALRKDLIETMDRLVNALDGTEPPFDKVRLLSLRSDLKSLTP